MVIFVTRLAKKYHACGTNSIKDVSVRKASTGIGTGIAFLSRAVRLKGVVAEERVDQKLSQLSRYQTNVRQMKNTKSVAIGA